MPKSTNQNKKQNKFQIQQQYKISIKDNKNSNYLMRQKYCLTSVSSFNDINTSSLNTSKTKQTYSFNRSGRFNQIKPICPKFTYDGNILEWEKHGITIGNSLRSDFTKSSFIVPASSQYKINSSFDQNKKKLRGSSLALSRQSIKFNQYINRQTLSTPTSTKYQYEKYEKYRSPSFSLRKRTKIADNNMMLCPQIYGPGPGAYNQSSDGKVAKYINVSFGVNKQHRFKTSENFVPGVGQYTVSISSKDQGRSINRYRGIKSRFGKQVRETFLDHLTKKQQSKPGPGFYRLPSEFGQYDGNVYGHEIKNGKFSQKKW